MSLKDDIKKPINLISVSIALISIILSFYFYVSSQQQRVPTFEISDERNLVFDSESSSPRIQVIDSDSNLISENIYLFTAKLWNSGSLSIEPEDVRRKVQLIITPSSRILDFNIVAQTNPDISEFVLTRNEISNDRTQVIDISWTHFDPGHGLKIQIIYTGSSDIDAYFEGVIVGVSNFVDGRSLADRHQWIPVVIFLSLAFIFDGIQRLRKIAARHLYSKFEQRFVPDRKPMVKFGSDVTAFVAIWAIAILGAFFVYLLVFKGAEAPV